MSKGKRIERLFGILKMLMDKKEVTLYQLTQAFDVSKRTIQRDIVTLRKAGFPIARKSPKSGVYRLDKDIKYQVEMFTEKEILILMAIRDALFSMGKGLSKTAKEIISRLLEYEDNIVRVHLDHPKLLDEEDEEKLSEIVNAIRERRIVSFKYRVFSEYSVRVKPYRLGFYRGLWYLLAEDKGKIKAFAVDKMEDVGMEDEEFDEIPEEVIQLESFSPFFSPHLGRAKVKILAAPEAAEFLKRKPIALSQKLLEERPDGSCVFEVEGFTFAEIINTVVKPWIPYVFVLEPKELVESIVSDVEGWIEKAKDAKNTIFRKLTP
ncbi:WYL domain-containing protein [Desulfurobacterium sp.]|uniref:helix-turn-helix transcriptional regulator n=1 Tax=Desulfurobacterium sp. TaxID=2004706 RepID=UPI002633088F|nr:WYL domain-containing protein [Desulfurobacterium sp.]